MEALFVGVKAAVLAIVVEALLRIAKRSLKDRADVVAGGIAFVAIFFFSVPFPLIVLAAAIFGFVRGAGARGGPAHRAGDASPPSRTLGDDGTVARHLDPAAPALALAFGPSHVLPGSRCSSPSSPSSPSAAPTPCSPTWRRTSCRRMAGSTPGEMLDGLGLAETTPGPLILVTEFVGIPRRAPPRRRQPVGDGDRWARW